MQTPKNLGYHMATSLFPIHEYMSVQRRIRPFPLYVCVDRKRIYKMKGRKCISQVIYLYYYLRYSEYYYISKLIPIITKQVNVTSETRQSCYSCSVRRSHTPELTGKAF